MDSLVNAHAGRGGFETRPYRRTLTGMFAIDIRIFQRLSVWVLVTRSRYQKLPTRNLKLGTRNLFLMPLLLDFPRFPGIWKRKRWPHGRTWVIPMHIV